MTVQLGSAKVWDGTGWQAAVGGGVSGDPEEIFLDVFMGFEEDGAVRRVNWRGDVVWSFTGHSATPLRVVVGLDGSIYSRGTDAIRKLDPETGNQVWAVTGYDGGPMTTDADGNVWAGTATAFAAFEIYKFDSAGTLQSTWSGDVDINSLKVDAVGNVFMCGNDGIGGDYEVRKYNSSGVLQWTNTSHTGTVTEIAIDGAYVYSAGDDSITFQVRKLDASTGAQQWSFSHPSNMQGVRVDKDGFVYTACDDRVFRKISPAGALVWSFDAQDGSFQSIAVSPVGDTYYALALAGHGVHSLDADGNPGRWRSEGRPRAIAVPGEDYSPFHAGPPELGSAEIHLLPGVFPNPWV